MDTSRRKKIVSFNEIEIHRSFLQILHLIANPTAETTKAEKHVDETSCAMKIY